MAETCEVVALGREDVCLEPKKLITSYEALQLSKAAGELRDAAAGVGDGSLTALLDATLRLIALVEKNQFDEIKAVLKGLDAKEVLGRGESEAKKKAAKEAAAALKALEAAVQKREASPAARSLMKLAPALGAFAGG